ncbi:MAG: hypothetical protein LBF36_02850 [Mycoplasmataceae bacterium]|jgi:hypothetical protein|nr:hypothetical protein [Mycoplasmataceae bacterium]
MPSKNNNTIKINIKDENEWIEKLKVQPTVRINLENLSNSSSKERKK